MTQRDAFDDMPPDVIEQEFAGVAKAEIVKPPTPKPLAVSAPAHALAVLSEGADRRTWLGGSDAGAIMGVGAKFGGEQQTPYTVWLKKTSEKREELDPQKEKFFRRRKRWEPVIVEMLREEFDAEIVSVNQRYTDLEHPFLAAEIDFEWRDPADGSIQNGEIKTVSPFAFGENQGWGEAWTDEVPIYYVAQCMHGLGVMRRRTCILAAMVGIDNMIFYRVERDDETIAGMREKCIKFWNEHVLPRIPPDPHTMDDMMALFARVNGRPVECAPEIVDKLHQLAEIRASIKAYELDKDTVTFEIADYVRQQWGITDPQTPAQLIDNALLMRGGAQIGSWKKQRGASLDQKRFREEHPDLHAGYMREHWFRPIRIKKL